MDRIQYDLDFLRMEEHIFHLSDMGMRFFQVKDGYHYQILVQNNDDKNAPPSLPKRYDSTNPSQMKPICEGSTWCLDRCVGTIDICNKDNILLDADTDVVEIEPCYRRLNAVAEGYPSGDIKTSRLHRHVDILLPRPNPTADLERLVGCNDIKRRLTEFKSLAEYNKACLKKSPNLPVMRIFLHSIFYGNPGTGKTTVCRLYGSLLKETGLLSKGHVVVADRTTFCGDSFGDEEAIVTQLLEMSKGGILMFDEAYLLDGVHHEDPSQMVLPLLLSALADEKNKDFAVVLCGYKDKIDKLLKQNPGLYSRFVNRFEFKDYTLDELTEIGIRYLKTFGHTFSLDGLASFRKELSIALDNSSTSTWANARSVKNMIEHTYIQRAMRYKKGGKIDREITAEDISAVHYERRRRIGFSA